MTRRRKPVRDAAARDALVLANMGLVGHAVKRRWPRLAKYGTWDDWCQTGTLGLLRAAELWDETRGVKFSTYAYRSVLSTIDTEQRRLGVIRVATNALCHETTRPLARRVADVKSFDRVRRYWRYWKEPEYRDPVPLYEADEVARLLAAVRRLPARARHVVRRCCLEGGTLREVGAELGVTKERVRQLRVEGLARLWELMTKH